MPLPKLDQKTLDTAQKGFVRLVSNATEVNPTAMKEVITGVDETKGFYLGGLSAAPSLGSSDEMVDQVENIYGVFGPVRGAFQIQSSTHALTVSLLKATPKIYSMIFPDWQEEGDWTGASPDGGTTPGDVVGKVFSRSGVITNSSYLDNICICYEGQTSDDVGMIVKLNNVLNRADEKSLEADDDGNLFGFEVELTAHEDFSGALGEERVAPMQFYLPSYMLDTQPA